MKRAIVTGATGVIGSALIAELVSNGVEVLVLCREGSSRNNVIPCHPLVERRYCSLDGLHDLANISGKEYDVFFHLAWEGTTGASRNDLRMQLRNIQYSLDAVDVAKHFGCRTFVGIGSQAEYGRVEGLLTPTTPVSPENGYGMAKLAAGQMTREFARQNGLRHIWIRVVSVYGPNDGPQTLVMSLIAKLRAGEIPRLTKCEQQWDYLYSGDAARAIYLLGDKGHSGKTYVLGGGHARPLREYVEIIHECVNPNVQIQVMHLCADVSEIQIDTGWKPVVSFEDGIERLIQWGI